ncbi:MAG: GNAT family N-acetyltransferase [Planctomycetaceae bacterium]|nr:GNAT family N-acetyltransferase [Planctomycetaceae bacterium]
MRLNICIATADDVDELAELFVDSVRSAGPRGYTPRQVDSWAASASDRERFQEFILKPTTYIAIDESGPVGFCGIEANGHIASLYLRGDRQRQGIGTQLVDYVLDYANRAGINRLHAEASEFSLPLFLKLGFQTVGTETVERNGATFVRHLVESHLNFPANHSHYCKVQR